MALEKIGLGGVLTFDEKQAVRGMGSAGRAADRFKGQFNAIIGVARQVGAGLNQAATSMRGLGVASLPATAAIGLGINKAQSFEKQMSAVGAITGATAEQMARLEAEAKKQGATTAFSATEAAQGMEFLSRAGFSVDQQIAALAPTLNAAAADGIDLATSADIVSNTLKGLALPAENAARAADVLALTSARTNTNLIGLGEAMKFAAPQSKTLGVELETTSALLGAVADAGLRGTIGGTSLTQALVKLTKPTSAGQKLLEQFNVTMTKTADGGLDVVDVFKQINAGLSKETDVVKKAAMQTEIFGIRGQKAFAAAATAIDSGKLDELIAELATASEDGGAAARMAEKRLDNLAGAFTLFQSAAEGFALETAGAFLGPMTEGVKGFTTLLSDVVVVLQELNSEQGLTAETADKAGSTVVAVATGIKEGIDLVIDAWVTLRGMITSTIQEFTGQQSPDMIQQFTKVATVIFLVAGALAPVFLAIGGFALFITSVVIPAISAIGTIMGAVFGGPVLIAIGVAVAAFALIRREGESIGETFTRVWTNIVSLFDWVMETAVKPFIAGFEWVPNVFDFVLMKFNDFVSTMRQNFGDVIAAIVQAAQVLAPVFKAVFTFIGNVVGVIVMGIGLAFTTMLDFGASIATKIKNIFISVVESIVNFIKGAAELAGKAASLVGLDFGKSLQEFGRGEFRVKVGAQQRGLGGGQTPETTGDAATRLAELEAQRQAEGMIFTPGNIDDIASAVGGAVGANMPKEMKVESKVCVDGKTIAKATSKHKQEINERAGFKATPWQRRASVEQGAAPVGGV